MSKRPGDDLESNESLNFKRHKFSKPPLSNSVTLLDIASGKQLQKLLTFSQDPQQSLKNVQAFKSFLDGILASHDSKAQTHILKDYLESQKLILGEEEPLTYLPDIFQTWKFALQSNNENILSAVPSVLALLVRVISNSFDLSTYGKLIGNTLLHKNHQELIKRGLTANKSKEYVISPVLRLLRELSMLDGGALSDNIFRARNFTFQALTRNLNLKYVGVSMEEIRKPSVRTNAVRFVLQLLKYLPIKSKKELLREREIFFVLTRFISGDPPFLVRDILETLKTHIVNDELLPREAKTRILTTGLLEKIISLYRYDKEEEKSETSELSIPDSAHKVLLLICTSLNSGLLLNQSGLYPKGLMVNHINGNVNDISGPQIHLGLDSIEWIHNYTEKIAVRNVILSDFIRTLRPWSSIKENELILSVFKSAPELIAEYFLSKNSFLPDPKLTAYWVGYSNFVYGTIKLSLPNNFGHEEGYADLPPPLSILMENLLPKQLNRKLLTKCLGQTANKLIAFFVVRILCLAFQKLQAALRMCREASKASCESIWNQYALRVAEVFSERCPAINVVIAGYRRLEPSDLFQREAFTKLLTLYYEVLPLSVTEAKSNAPVLIGETMMSIEKIDFTLQKGVLRALELENIFRIANLSPGVRWFSRGVNCPISLFLAMLRLSAIASPDAPLLRLKNVLISVVQETQIFQTRPTDSMLDYFIMSLRNIMTDDKMEDFYEYIDSCLTRCVATPIKYIFKLEEFLSENNIAFHDSNISLLPFAMLDQWKFHVKAVDASALQKTALFISQYLGSHTKLIGDKKIIKFLSESFANACPNNSEAQQVMRNYKKFGNEIRNHNYYQVPSRDSKSITATNRTAEKQTSVKVEHCREIVSSEDNNALVRWRKKDVDDVIEDGHIGNLVILLSSKHLSIRREALTQILMFAQNLKDSKFEEKDQIWLLLSELSASAKEIINKSPLPRIFSSFAYHSIGILKDPSHHLFPKINKFLSRSPTWQLDKIPLMYSIMNEPPSSDGKVCSEREWLLKFLLDGLGSEIDLEIFRKRSVFERLLSWYHHDHCQGLQDTILKILVRACSINNASTTLVTRFSVVTWLEVQEALSTNTVLHNLYQDLLKSCNQKRIMRWSRRAIKSKEI
ncbi:Nucleolar pre-ribosomal-associated protein 1 [Golovinomyces cichoracearum]|uniref:Nucleolar pre-ribosomal-associated protein 1 n=1 Tax=Golovinomyces cichoracearum TaxID=62708 RepID=A0A420J9M8_9PEZI|nr:Nucleolar pre-ribosomal-associated protein 1 [Golovinomyces cichoracearum]